MIVGKPLYIYAPYGDQPWFYVESSDPSQSPAAQPYYQGRFVEQLKNQLDEARKLLAELAAPVVDGEIFIGDRFAARAKAASYLADSNNDITLTS